MSKPVIDGYVLVSDQTWVFVWHNFRTIVPHGYTVPTPEAGRALAEKHATRLRGEQDWASLWAYKERSIFKGVPTVMEWEVQRGDGLILNVMRSLHYQRRRQYEAAMSRIAALEASDE